MKTSPLFSINLKDVIKGLIMAALTPVVFLIQQTIESGKLTFNWRSIGMAAIGGGVAYIIKQYFTPAPPVQTTTPDGTVTEKVISTDNLSVKVDAIK